MLKAWSKYIGYKVPWHNITDIEDIGYKGPLNTDKITFFCHKKTLYLHILYKYIGDPVENYLDPRLSMFCQWILFRCIILTGHINSATSMLPRDVLKITKSVINNKKCLTFFKVKCFFGAKRHLEGNNLSYYRVDMI